VQRAYSYRSKAGAQAIAELQRVVPELDASLLTNPQAQEARGL